MSMSLYASKEEYEQAHAARWYCLDRDGVAMLCKDEADARTQAAESDDCWPGRAPHRAVLLGEVNAALDQKHAEYEDLKACAANNARNLALEIEGWRRIAQLHPSEARDCRSADMALSKWIPESDPMVLRRVGKTGEECAELAKVCSRITIQGLDGVDPATGETNRQALTKEVADVMAQCLVTMEALGLDSFAIHSRKLDKVAQMAEWEAMFSQPAA